MSTKIARLLRSVIGGLARRWPVPTYAVVGAAARATAPFAAPVALFARWDGGRVKIFVGDPIPAGDDERTMALAVARDFDRYLRAHPGELTDWMLAGLIDGQPPQPRE